MNTAVKIDFYFIKFAKESESSVAIWEIVIQKATCVLRHAGFTFGTKSRVVK